MLWGGRGSTMSTQLQSEPGLSDREMNDSIRVMKQERTLKLAGVFAATIFGIAVLLFAAYLGLTT
jgi:hypothetical protein